MERVERVDLGVRGETVLMLSLIPETVAVAEKMEVTMEVQVQEELLLLVDMETISYRKGLLHPHITVM